MEKRKAEMIEVVVRGREEREAEIIEVVVRGREKEREAEIREVVVRGREKEREAEMIEVVVRGREKEREAEVRGDMDTRMNKRGKNSNQSCIILHLLCTRHMYAHASPHSDIWNIVLHVTCDVELTEISH